MKRILMAVACSTIFSTLALAANWSGTLLDGLCYDQQYQQLQDVQKAADTCSATDATTAFALNVSGKILKFDSNGNSKAIAAVRNRADRVDPAKELSPRISAKVDGTEKAGMIAVDNVEVQ